MSEGSKLYAQINKNDRIVALSSMEAPGFVEIEPDDQRLEPYRQRVWILTDSSGAVVGVTKSPIVDGECVEHDDPRVLAFRARTVGRARNGWITSTLAPRVVERLLSSGADADFSDLKEELDRYDEENPLPGG